MTKINDMVSTFAPRRRSLGMSMEALAKRSRVSRATVYRVLSGDHESASFAKVVAIAKALGINPRFDEVDEYTFREQQAEKRARYLVGMVQGTMALEAQGVGASDVDRMVRDTTHKLMAGSKTKLWG